MKSLRRSSTTTASRPQSSSFPTSSWIYLRSLLLAASSPVPDRGILRSQCFRRKRNHALTRRYWNGLFKEDGRFCDGGVRFLKKARSRGVDPSIRAEVWPFLLGVYDLNSSEVERNADKVQKRKEYEKLRRRCHLLSNHFYLGNNFVRIGEICSKVSHNCNEDSYFTSSEDDIAPLSLSAEENGDEDRPVYDRTPDSASCKSDEEDDEDENDEFSVDILASVTRTDPKLGKSSSIRSDTSIRTAEDFNTWQRIIRLDAIRANADSVFYSLTKASIGEEAANRSAEAVGLKNYDHLEPCMIHHAARLVAILEAYAVYDPETGYCQGMSDLLSPILAVMEDDFEAFWCFVGFMRKARHNFRLDEFGIRRQLAVVSRIIRLKDGDLFWHLEKLGAEDCFFVYRMVVVLFRRELTFEQTLSLWEVMWADQAAIRAGIGNSACGRMRMRPPPTDDLLLFTIAACVLQRRKLIIEKYISLDEIIKDCNTMAGKLDVWRLLDDAHDLVITLHNKI
ncbi:hypothetical protein AXF42_Ash006348 [Apostasia shenzhenica]|uniref:Rab-GAP TBC domain-containing protein n=1 Tax=Apostasia shenzhenica TaxID=1088818 RepID=A0A2I0AYV2_9ASPA|nr:hypothetical protein AXF42_Ash006348 [Apostasia shenzhenica]